MVMFAEVKKDGQWQKVGAVFKSTYEELNGRLTDRVFDGYNKELESFLIVYSHLFCTDESECSEEVNNHKAFKGGAGFVITLEELLKLGWNDEKYKVGYISEWQYERFKKDGITPVAITDKPIIPDVKSVTPFEMDLIIKYPVLRTARKYYVAYKYDKRTYAEMFSFFCYESLPALIKCIPEGGTVQDVRIVFNT